VRILSFPDSAAGGCVGTRGERAVARAVALP